MSQVKSEGSDQPCAPATCTHTAVYRQTSYNQSYGVSQGRPAEHMNEWMQTLPPMADPSAQTPCTLQYFWEMLHCMQHYCMLPMPVRFSEGGPVSFLHTGAQNLPSMAMTSTPITQHAANPQEYKEETLDGPQPNTTAGDLTACQLPHPSSSLPQGVAGAGAHSSHKPLEDALQKRELRLMKNREAARECRRKKKEYVRCLENRVAVLENQNKTLIEELRALKDIYRHKAE